MKLFLVAALASSAAAFAPVPSARINTALQAAGADAIEAALAASKEHGPTSKEARVLWDIVEEMDSADNSAAYKPAVVDEAYEEKVLALGQMLTKTTDELNMMKSLAEELKGVKLAQPPSTSASTHSSSDDVVLKDALSAAQSASAEFGKDSSEAKLAWETVEEIAASSGDSAAMQASLDEECLIDLIEGCEALEKFKTALDSR